MYKTLHKKQGSVTVQLRFARSSVTFCAKRDTILFFSGEKWLRDGWYYIPDRAIAIALGLCVFWQIVLTAGTCFLMAWIRKKFDGWMRMIIRVPVIVAAVFLFLFLAWNWFLYSLGSEQKVEQYDEHIALYVTNTFVRTRFRYPHYMYEENWLFMRSLSDEEQQEAVLQYGDPDDYYREYH